MVITEITVSVHEKRNHPFEYGHYDSSVTLTATISPNERRSTAIRDLQDRAAFYVKQQCDEWEKGIREARQIAH